MNIGDKVKTNDYYTTFFARFKKHPIAEAVIIGINGYKVTIKVKNGSEEIFDEAFLETI